MKKFKVIAALLSIILFASCQEDSDTFNEAAIEEMDLSTELSVEASLEEVDLISEAGMETLSEFSGGRVDRDVLLECAEIDRDTVNHIITIDFGDGCEGPNGAVRKGKIIIEYNLPRNEVGAYRIVTFEDFYIDSVHIEGIRKMENTSDSTSTRQFTVTLTGGLLSFPDGTTYSREASHVRNLYHGETIDENYATLHGEAKGENRRGQSYHVVILERLVFKRRCHRDGIIVPVAGVIQKVIGDKVATIDFGDGNCDNIAIVTIDGESKRIEIYPRFRKRL